VFDNFIIFVENYLSMKGKLIIFSAPSGSGKTTIARHLLSKDYNLEFSISACSRDKRHNEIDGIDYYFLTVDDFKNKIANDEFVEWEEVYKDHFYGTLRSEVNRIRSQGKNIIFDIDVLGGLNIKKQFEGEAIAIFVKAPSVEELENRLKNRKTDTEDKIAKRMERVKFELDFADKFDYIIINDNLKNAFAEAEKIISDFLEI